VLRVSPSQTPNLWKVGRVGDGCLTMTYFRTGAPYYHRRTAVSRSCSGWEGVVPAGYGRQALTGIRGRGSGIREGTALRAWWVLTGVSGAPIGR
jgi:hypothetical protein